MTQIQKRTRTHAAEAAALIRKELKNMGIVAQVTCKNYSGGNSIKVRLTDQPHHIKKQVEKYCSQFEYGSFDGMTDCYNADNVRGDIPQVKFLFVENEMSNAKRQEIYSKLRSHYNGMDALPEAYEAARNERFHNDYVSQMVWQEFNKGA